MEIWRVNYEWDRGKDAANAAKHGIEFIDAVAVFDDPDVVIEETTRPEHGEQRWKATGVIGRSLYTVVFTDRPTGRRIISARKARTNERREHRQSTA